MSLINIDGIPQVTECVEPTVNTILITDNKKKTNKNKSVDKQ